MKFGAGYGYTGSKLLLLLPLSGMPRIRLVLRPRLADGRALNVDE